MPRRHLALLVGLTFLACVLLLLAPLPASAAPREKLPPWVTTLHTQPITAPKGEASAIRLLDESSYTYDATGLCTEHLRGAIRILTSDGTKHAIAAIGYNQRADRVKTFQAWVARTGSASSTLDPKRSIDTAVTDDGAVTAEQRRRRFDATGDVVAGDTLVWEAVIEHRQDHLQHSWFATLKLPVQRSAVSFTLPAGWEVRSLTFGAAPIAPKIDGATRTWLLTDLPALPDEPFAVPGSDQGIWLAFDLLTPPGRAIGIRPSSTWEELGRSFTAIYDPRAIPDDAVRARAAAAVAGAATSLERLRALARVAQDVTYVAIALNLAKGGGYVPRPATDVCRLGYGDCKDKSTYLIALLRAQGLAAYPVIVNSGETAALEPSWVAPGQFNHCIAAIPVDDTVAAPAIITHPKLGRLLIFDPTRENIPFGYLDERRLHPQGLLIAGEASGLITLPPATPGANHLSRRVTARLGPTGELAGSIEETFAGTTAEFITATHRELKPADFTQGIARMLGETLPAARVSRVDPQFDYAAGTFRLGVDFTSPTYGKPMRNVLLVFKPAIAFRRETMMLDRKARTLPIRVAGYAFDETATIELPEGFRVDELPPPVTLESEFGRYEATVRLEGRTVHATRRCDIRPTDLPPTAADAVRTFFTKMVQAEQTPVVLEKL